MFILYAVAAFLLLALFFFLSYRYDSGAPPGPRDDDYDSRYSYMSPRPDDENENQGHSKLGKMAAAGAAGVGLAGLFRRRNRDHDPDGSQHSYMDEKYSDEEPRHSGWGSKFLKLGALGGGAMLAKRFFSRRRERESDAESGRYQPAHRRADSMTEESMSRLDDHPPPQSSHPGPINRPPSRPPSRPQSPNSSYYDYSYLSREDERPSHGLRNALLGGGAFAAIKGLFNRGKGKTDEQRHVEELRRHDLENEKLARANSKRRFTGDGFFPQRQRPASQSATDASTDLTPRPHRAQHPPESAISERPTGPGAVDGAHSDLPPAPPIHYDPASSMTPTGPAAPQPPQPPVTPAAAAASGSAGPSSGHLPPPGGGSWQRDSHADSPPVSLKVKMHDDGRNITLRRLTEEEAAAGREARRRERRQSRRRTGSGGSLSGNEGTGSRDRWRRVEELERQQQEQMDRERAAAASASQQPLGPGNGVTGHSIPPESSFPAQPSYPPQQSTSNLPPPRAPSTNPYGSITSPGTYTGTENSEYATNRRRRRAERARARQERQGHSVEFT